MKKIIYVLIITLFSCTASQHLHNTGKYVVAKATKQPTGTMVQLQNVKGSYLLLSDTLKVNDTIIINVISIREKKN